jgi:hypothetical protein
MGAHIDRTWRLGMSSSCGFTSWNYVMIPVSWIYLCFNFIINFNLLSFSGTFMSVLFRKVCWSVILLQNMLIYFAFQNLLCFFVVILHIVFILLRFLHIFSTTVAINTYRTPLCPFTICPHSVVSLFQSLHQFTLLPSHSSRKFVLYPTT